MRLGERGGGEGAGGGSVWGWGQGVGILGLMALLLVVTSNVRRLSVRETNRRRLIEKCGGKGEAGKMGDGIAD